MKQYNFPYKPLRKIVIVGGQPAWIKNIRQYFQEKEIIFISDENKNTTKNYNSIVSSADVLWCKNNGISHDLYKKILVLSRKYNIDTQYFKINLQGGKSCAIQIIDYESQKIKS